MASFFALIFSLTFYEHLSKRLQNQSYAATVLVTFSRHFRDPVFYVDFMLNLVTILVPFGALWLTLGSLLAPFGSLLVPLGSLLLTLALDFLTFGASWRHFSYFCVLSKEIACKIIFL